MFPLPNDARNQGIIEKIVLLCPFRAFKIAQLRQKDGQKTKVNHSVTPKVETKKRNRNIVQIGDNVTFQDAIQQLLTS